MPKPSSRFRLQSSAFARNDETEKINPKRMIFRKRQILRLG